MKQILLVVALVLTFALVSSASATDHCNAVAVRAVHQQQVFVQGVQSYATPVVIQQAVPVFVQQAHHGVVVQQVRVRNAGHHNAVVVQNVRVRNQRQQNFSTRTVTTTRSSSRSGGGGILGLLGR